MSIDDQDREDDPRRRETGDAGDTRRDEVGGVGTGGGTGPAPTSGAAVADNLERARRDEDEES